MAGYNIMNEPADPKGSRVEPFYRRVMQAVRAIDSDHMLFLEGNRYSTEFHMFGDPLPNVVYTNHDYALAGFMDAGPYPGVSRGEYVDRQALEDKFLKRSEYMLEYDIPMWVGEFGPIYTGRSETDAMRFRVLRDQLDRGTTDAGVRHIIGPIENLFEQEFPNYQPFPFGAQRHIAQLVRHMLLSEPMLDEFAERFRGISAEDIDTLMRSFLFENCRQRTELAQTLASYA